MTFHAQQGVFKVADFTWMSTIQLGSEFPEAQIRIGTEGGQAGFASSFD